MKKPVIGVVSQWRDHKSLYSMFPGYITWIQQAGGVPLMLPFLHDSDEWEAAVDALDGILFTGGPDLNPSLYKEEVMEVCGPYQPQRDEAEKMLVEVGVLGRGKPALGICKGCQIINVMLGGSLYQDIHTQHPDRSVYHDQPQKKWLPSHSIAISQESPLAKVLGKNTAMVNSYHHQAVKSLAPGLTPMATAPDGIIEAFWGGKGFLWGLQWHPEMFREEHEDSMKIFTAFVDACRHE